MLIHKTHLDAALDLQRAEITAAYTAKLSELDTIIANLATRLEVLESRPQRTIALGKGQHG